MSFNQHKPKPAQQNCKIASVEEIRFNCSHLAYSVYPDCFAFMVSIRLYPPKKPHITHFFSRKISGWCCCCCRCKFCNPRNEIDEVKTFCANNPVGVYHEDGVLVKYTPTAYESYAQKNLEKAIDRL